MMIVPVEDMRRCSGGVDENKLQMVAVSAKRHREDLHSEGDKMLQVMSVFCEKSSHLVICFVRRQHEELHSKVLIKNDRFHKWVTVLVREQQGTSVRMS